MGVANAPTMRVLLTAHRFAMYARVIKNMSGHRFACVSIAETLSNTISGSKNLECVLTVHTNTTTERWTNGKTLYRDHGHLHI